MILFRSTGDTQDLPSWLEGCTEVQRLTTDGATVFAVCDPLYLAAPAAGTWRPLMDGWQIALVGDPELGRLLRRRPDLQRAEVADPMGRIWHAPLILSADGDCLLDIPYGRDEAKGTFVRRPNAEQTALVAAATGAREQIVGPGLGSLPIAVALDWVGLLYEATYHLPRQAFYALELIGDALIAGTLLATSGWPKPIEVVCG